MEFAPSRVEPIPLPLPQPIPLPLPLLQPQVLPQPLPLTELSYLSYAPRRPGLLTAVGIASMVIGTLSAGAGILGISAGLGFMTMAQMRLPANTSVASTVFHVNNGASVATVAEAIGSCLAGALLVLAGSHMLRNSPKSWRMHRMFIVMKVPLAVLNGFANWWVCNSIVSYQYQVGSAPDSGQAASAIAMGVGMTLLSIAYPVALLILLSTKTSKNFLAELRQFT